MFVLQIQETPIPESRKNRPLSAGITVLSPEMDVHNTILSQVLVSGKAGAVQNSPARKQRNQMEYYAAKSSSLDSRLDQRTASIA